VLIVATLVCYRIGSAAQRLIAPGDEPFADTSKDKTMNLSSSKRPLLLGLALAVTGAAGAAVAVTLAVASPSAPQTPPVVPAAQASPAGAAASIAPAAASGTPPVATTAPAVAAVTTPTVISLDQARGIAERAGNGQADKVQADTGPTGLSYDVSVTRSDGTDVEVIIDGHTGRILSTVAEPQNPQDSNTPDPQDGTN
jgi:hypothetical protein